MAERNLAILVTARNLSQRVLGQVKGDINGVEGAARRAGSNMTRNLTVAGVAAGAGLALQVRAGVDSLVELERVENLTAAALESTGNVARQSVEGIRARAEALEHLTGTDDKAIQNAENLLLTFTNVKEDAFEPTLEAALNLNAALGGNDESLQGVLLQVAKAVNDPVRGMTALRRSGVSFTQAQQNQVKAMVEANDLMGAQRLILGELETQFGGAAEAANQGATRAQRRWTDGVEDIQKSLATGFLPLIERVSTKMSELVADPEFLARVQGFGEAIASGFDEAIDFAESVDWGAVGSALETMGTGARMAMDAFLSAPPWLQTAILTGWGLNKLTGGGLGSIVGALGSGLIKGVLGMNAGVVNINAGTVVGGPGGGIPGVGGRGPGGGLLGGLGRGLVTGGVVGGAAALTGIAAVKIIEFQGMRTELQAGLGTKLDALPRTTVDQTQRSIDKIQSIIDQERPLLDSIVFNTNVKPQLDAELAELQQTRTDLARNLVRGTDQTSRTIDRVNSTMNLERSAQAARDATTQARLSSIRSESAAARGLMSQMRDSDRQLVSTAAAQAAIARESSGKLSGLLARRSSTAVTVNVQTHVNVQEWQRTATSSIRAATPAGGGLATAPF